MAQAVRKSQPERNSSRRPRVAVRRRKAVEEKQPKGNELVAFVLGAFGLFLLFALWSHIDGLYSNEAFADPATLSRQNAMGYVGYRVARILFRLLGWCSLVSVIWAWLLARSVYNGTLIKGAGRLIVGACFSVVLAISAATIASIFYDSEGGGSTGLWLSSALLPYLNRGGTVLLAAFIMILSFVASTGVELAELFGFTAKTSRQLSKGAAVGLSAAGRVSGKAVAAQIGVSKLLIAKAAEAAKNRKERAPQVVDKAWDFGSGKDWENEDADDREFVDEEIPSKKVKVKAAPLLLPPPEVIDVTPIRPDSSEKPKVTLKEMLKRKKKREYKKETTSTPGSFSLPPLDLLGRSDAPPRSQVKDDELLKNCKQLEKALLDFKLGGKIVEVQPGPVITLYEFEPAPGVKVQRIISLADDLALALKVASVRVYAPVPGKGTVGIEVPNQNREIVWLRDILDSDLWAQSEDPLLLALGKDTFGEPYVADLSKMPHLLIAGSTGTGKSVSINSLLLSLLYRSTPEQLRLILIDPKMLELSVYDKIPHLKAPVVTNPKRARGVLWWAVEEMERRYRVMMELGVRNLEGYNKFIDEEGPRAPVRRKTAEEASDGGDKYIGEVLSKLPHIVIVVDEFADLMLTVGREVEELITRLAQKARAAGIHIILATQRPSVNVITGLIKANFPSRISFKVASRIDSRTVLDGSGSERLLGHGDMLFIAAGTSRAKRLHGAFVSDSEVHQVVKWWRSQGAPDYDPQIEDMISKLQETEAGEAMGSPDAEFEYDPLYDQALKVVVDKGQASTSMIQRVFRIGYNRAARILEMMERDGVVGPADGARPRQILAAPLQEE